ncbi:hypothetical protein LMG29542_05849 [Paraburkholderia humisilvae]|uniref:Uncharacterized protein n=1 Tax=Paraburkholderia humisilvae TaxID=627669 RepID=A0A6J5ER36_9BURK|nr:hypothetical protein LMG29542_05849 [Paraburkholderia humisilvae]
MREWVYPGLNIFLKTSENNNELLVLFFSLTNVIELQFHHNSALMHV